VTAATGIFIPLVLTIVIESLVLGALIPLRWTEVLFYSVFINTTTLPPATYLYHAFLHNLFLVEVLVIIAETVLIALLFRLPVRRSCALSLTANTISAIIGILIAGF
jgi:hypothetical protein